jgi:hypothetical protein
MNRKNVTTNNRKNTSIYIPKNYTSSFFLFFFFFSFWHMQPKKRRETQPKGNYQVAVKNNATVDNHQAI